MNNPDRRQAQTSFRSLADIAADHFYTNVYVASALESLSDGNASTSFDNVDSSLADLLGIIPCPTPTNANRSGYRLLRVLGLSPTMLSCDSTVLIYTNQPVYPFTQSNCSPYDVGYIRVAPNETLQTATISYSLLSTSKPSGCGCSGEGPIGTASSTEVKLGTHDLPKGTRLCSRHGVDTRDEQTRVYATITHPSLGDFIQIARECAVGSATVTFVTAYATGVAAAEAVAVFKASFYLCLRLRVGEAIANGTDITFGKEDIHGGWSGH